MRLLAPLCLLALSLAACASMEFQTAGRTPSEPLCQRQGDQIIAIVLWGARWRPDQKDVPLREVAAERGIERFFASSGCYAAAQVLRSVGGYPALELSLAELRKLAISQPTPSTRALFITVRELGPVLKLGLPTLVEGGTDVVLDIRSINLATGATLADFQAHWQNGGPGYIKGTASLDQDIGSALKAALLPGSAS